MPQKRTHKGAQIIAIIIAILLLCVAGFCAYLLIHNQQQKAEQKEMFATIAENAWHSCLKYTASCTIITQTL